MIKNTIFICLVVVFSYYAGAKGLTPVKIMDWFDKRKINKTIEDVFNKSIEIAEKNKIPENTSKVIDSFK